MSEEEAANVRLARIKRGVLNDRHIAQDDAVFLLQRHDEAVSGLRVQQELVTTTAEHWRKIGYEEGYEDGYEAGAGASLAGPEGMP